MNPAKIFQLKASWDRFAAAHPKFPLFLRAVSDGNVMQEGTIAEITITTADGRKYETNLKLTANDLQLLNSIRKNNELIDIIYMNRSTSSAVFLVGASGVNFSYPAASNTATSSVCGIPSFS